MSPKKVFPNARRLGIEIHKFGGASLADAAAFRRVVEIVKTRTQPRIVVVSAPAGVTDVLLGLAMRAATGDGDGGGKEVADLRDRYLQILRGAAARGTKEVADEIARSMDELGRLLSSLAVLKELTARTRDFIVSRGERLSARLLAAALSAGGLRARYVDATEIIFTDGPFGGASPNLVLTDLRARKALRPLCAAGIIPVVPGFIGAAKIEDKDGDHPHHPASHGHGGDDRRTTGVATLGRGGTDLTATLLGRALSAREVSLWKDVPGLLTADPRVVPDARVIPQLHAREAAELAYYGAKVLHPRALIPIAGRSIPVFVRPFADATAAGTEISARHTLDRYPVKALSAVGGQALLTVAGNGMLGVPGIAARTFEALHREGISVSLISQSSSEQSICFSVPEGAARRARHRLTEEFREQIARGEIDGVEAQSGLATVAVVGLGMHGHLGIAARVFSALAEAKINIVAIAQGSSELNISFVVAAKDAGAAQRAVHAAFQLSKIGGGAAARTAHTDAVLLGFGQIGRALAKIMAQGKAQGRAPKSKSSKLRLVAAIDRRGFVFDPNGLSPRTIAALSAAKVAGKSVADGPGGRLMAPADALAALAEHALGDPILVDVTADESTPLIRQALGAGMDVVLANKRPISGPRAESEALAALAANAGRRLLTEATVGAGLPIFDTHRKLVESGDRVLKIEGCLSGTLGFVLTEVERGKPFSAALRRAMELGYTEPDPRDDLSGIDVGRKALILGRLLAFAGEPSDVAVESLVPTAMKALPPAAFIARLDDLDADWSRRAAAAKAKGATLRYVATVTKGRISVGLRTVDRSSPFFGLKGTDNQVAFTTSRYRKNPLVITGPGAGPAVTAAGVLNDMLRVSG
jgi:aspartokinase/homoserine dehydrogenase 1